MTSMVPSASACQHGLPIIGAAQRRRKPGKGAEIADRNIRQHEMRRSYPGGDSRHRGPWRRGPAPGGAGGDLAEMEPRTGQLGQRNIARYGQSLGLGRGGRQA
jgi:hypothetical protein